MQEKLINFWKVYDTYMKTRDISLRKELSRLINDIEILSRQDDKPAHHEDIFKRPEKDWDKILGWQVLDRRMFYFSNNHHFEIYEGEIIIRHYGWDRDYLVTRNPSRELICGNVLNPGLHIDSETKEKYKMSDYDWEQVMKRKGLRDERGLYLPIFEVTDLVALCDLELAKIRPRMIKYLNEEGGIKMSELLLEK